MLKISKLSDYAVSIISSMGVLSSESYSAKRLSEVTGIFAPTVSKLLKQLQDADLLCSSRGTKGGYQLLRSANEISVADVIEAIEGRLALTECSQAGTLCHLDQSCAFKNNWTHINQSIYKVLSDVSIADMGRPFEDNKE